LKPISGPELCRALEKDGWALRRVKGSHHIYTKPGVPKTISIPVHGNQPLKPELATKLVRDAGITI